MGVMAMLVAGCSAGSHSTDRGIYFWKTTFDPNDYELNFLQEHRINKLYVRMFDVVEYHYEPRPNATLSIKQAFPDGVEVIPVVYIDNGTLANMVDEDYTDYYRQKSEELVDKVLARVDKMMQSVGKEYGEVQFDCDWTERTFAHYKMLCQVASNRLHASGKRFSSTVRLWQTRGQSDSIEADSRVLMLYNVGAIPSRSTKNSIIDSKTVKEYMSAQGSDGVSHGVALPAYGWGVLFTQQGYAGLLHQEDYSDMSLYDPCGKNWVVVKRQHVVDGRTLQPGDSIRVELSEPDVVMSAIDALPSRYDGIRVIYHLDSANLSRYNYDEIEAYYTR